jgi:TolB-like protein/DNA-binding winged helix-turn-helix (wHTH) protein
MNSSLDSPHRPFLEMPTGTQSIRFGRAELHPAERQLLVDRRPVAIGARAFDVLSLLVAHRERVVSKHELLEAVWPGLVVEENNLAVQVSTLRKVLGAAAITTIPGQGYQFTATPAGDREAPDDPAPDFRRSAAPIALSSSGRPAEPVLQPARHLRRVAAHPGALFALGVTVLLGLGIGALNPRHAAEDAGAGALPGGAAALPPPAHSVAVLPFVNMSGDPRQDGFSDDLYEDLLSSLARVRNLQVAAPSPAPVLEDKDPGGADVGRKLNVATLLQGSVRKDGEHVRVSAQLVNVATGYLLWSQTYDSELKDTLRLRTQVATAVTEALQATLLSDTGTSVERGGTHHPQALDAYLRAVGRGENAHAREDYVSALESIAEAIRLDPEFAKAYVAKAQLLSGVAAYVPVSDVLKTLAQAHAAAERAVALAPDLGQAHAQLAHLDFEVFSFTRAATEYERALALAPADARVQAASAGFFAAMKRADEAAASARRAVALEPLSASAHSAAGMAWKTAHRYREAIEEFDRALSLQPQLAHAAVERGLAYLALGELEPARQSCAAAPIGWSRHMCLAITYGKLGRDAAAKQELAALRVEIRDVAAFQYAEIYAQWGDVPKALDWIEKAYELHDPGLIFAKVDELLDPIRQEPRFQQVERKLNFPA